MEYVAIKSVRALHSRSDHVEGARDTETQAQWQSPAGDSKPDLKSPVLAKTRITDKDLQVKIVRKFDFWCTEDPNPAMVVPTVEMIAYLEKAR